MTIKVKRLGPMGHETFNLTLDEAREMIKADQGRYFIVDAETTKVLQEIKIKDGQTIMLVPAVAGG